MTDRTKEEAIKEVKAEITCDVICGRTIADYVETETHIRYKYWEKGVSTEKEPFIVTVKFTPPAPEFEKGIVGKFSDYDGDGSATYGEFFKVVDGRYLHRNGHSWKTFTPLIQNDPTLERAFELACEEHIGSFDCDKCRLSTSGECRDSRCLGEIKAHFLEMARGEK